MKARNYKTNSVHEYTYWIYVHIGFAYTMVLMYGFLIFFLLYDRNTNMCTHSQLECTEYSISLPFTFDLFHHWIGRTSHTAIDVLSFCSASAHIVAKYYLIRVNIEYVRQHYANAKFNANIWYVDDVLFLAVISAHLVFPLIYFVWRLFSWLVGMSFVNRKQRWKLGKLAFRM